MPKTRLEFGGPLTRRMMHKLCSFLAENPINPGDGDEWEDDGYYDGQVSTLTERERYALHMRWMQTTIDDPNGGPYSVVMDDDFEMRFGAINPVPLYELCDLCTGLGLAWRYHSLGGIDEDETWHDREVTLGGVGVPLKGTCEVNGSGFAMLPLNDDEEFDQERIEAMLVMARTRIAIANWPLPKLVLLDANKATEPSEIVKADPPVTIAF